MQRIAEAEKKIELRVMEQARCAVQHVAETRRRAEDRAEEAERLLKRAEERSRHAEEQLVEEREKARKVQVELECQLSEKDARLTQTRELLNGAVKNIHQALGHCQPSCIPEKPTCDTTQWA
jgi:ParB-like chromosome segregation protein Spo0J